MGSCISRLCYCVAYAKDNEPCVVFMDEIDDIGMSVCVHIMCILSVRVCVFVCMRVRTCVYPTIRLPKCLSVTLVVILVLVYWVLVLVCNNDFALCVIAVFVMLKKSLYFAKALFAVSS